MIASKPKLVPVSVPWMISPSVPQLRAHFDSAGSPASVTFIGFFKCDDLPSAPDYFSQKPHVVERELQFEARPLSETAPFRMVRITFDQCISLRNVPAFSDIDALNEDDWDWSQVTSTLLPGETTEQNVVRTRDLWLSSGICPDPRMYEVVSPGRSIASNPVATRDWHQYLMLGRDEHIEFTCKIWHWEPGQPA
jgi:hypothetical protein